MDKIKKHRAKEITPYIETKSMRQLSKSTGGNAYEAIAIISKRSNQIAQELKEELHSKLDEFASTNDNLEEVVENREQIEISKYYERLPHPTLLAYDEFMSGMVYHRKPQEDTEEEEK